MNNKTISVIPRIMLKVKRSSNKTMSNRYIERLNYVRLSYYLINCGYFTQWLDVDDRGADFIAIKFDASTVYRIQLKSRVTLNRKYKNKDLYFAFPLSSLCPERNWVIVKFDDLEKIFGNQKTYCEKGSWSSASVPKKDREQVIKASLIKPVSFQWFEGQ